MKHLVRLLFSRWVAVVFGALVVVILINVPRLRHLEQISAIADEPAPSGWRPRLIVPEHENASLAWLGFTRQMFDRHESRVRHIDYENAPFGREVYATSPYRWWLGFLATADHAITGLPPGQSLERAAVIADPLLHALLLIATALLVIWRFGAFPAAVGAILMATLFPFAADFLPGMPRDSGLTQLCALGSVLLLVASFRLDGGAPSRRAGLWFFVAGVVGGLGLWVSVYRQVPVLFGIALGALGAAWVARRAPPESAASLPDPRLWRAWALGGALTSLLAYLAEFSPDHLGSWQMRAIHPVYSVAWLGGGEMLALATAWIARQRIAGRARSIASWIFALLAFAGLPLAMRLTKSWGFLATELAQLRLVNLPAGPSASNTLQWIIHDGLTPAVWATLLPLLLIGPAAWWLVRGKAGMADRLAIALVLGPVVVQLGFAGRWLSAWSDVGAALIVLGIVLATTVRTAGNPKLIRVIGFAFVSVLAVCGVVQLIPHGENKDGNSLNPQEVYGLVERDLARWLEPRIDPASAVILAPHNLSATLHYYSGLRGISSLAWENSDGLGVAIRITSASTPDEAKELIVRRGVTHLIMPSWDAYLDVYAQIGMGELDGTFLKNLHDWKLPPWLRPVPYQLPTIAGFEGEGVTILEVVEDQDEGVALSRMAEYFVEMTQLDRAAATAQALRRFPADLGALVARAQVEFARGDTAAFERTISLLKPRLTGKGDRNLPWDRRLSLAVVLTQAKQQDLARERVRRCIEELDESKLRSLSTGAVYRLMVLSRAYEAPIAEARLRELALNLLPADLRARF